MWAKTIILFTVVFFPSPNHAEEIHVQEHRTRPPNIVFIMADDLGFNDVGYHNKKGTYTPTINKLAKGGIILENYYVQPVCAPTRGQFISGRSQIHTGLQHKNIRRTQPNGLPLDSPTLPDKLKEAGYATDMVGKWHLGFYHKDYLPTSRGFDTFYGMYLGSGGHFSHKACWGQKCWVDLHNDTTAEQKPDLKQSGIYSTHLYTDEAVRIINQRSQADNPFFLFLSYQAVHGPTQVPRKYKKLIKRKLKSCNIGNYKRKKYIAMIYAMDYGVRRVMGTLKKNGVWNNTILVFSTDNGGTPKTGGSNLPLKGKKSTFYEGGIRGVAFVNSPLFKKTGYINTEMIHVTDWFPTFVALANGNLNGTRDVNGFNQWETLNYGSPSPREEILFNIDPLTKSKVLNYYRHSFDVRIKGALRKGDYKMITGTSDPPGFSLYNIQTDPLEKHDLSQLEVFRPKINEMLDILQEHQKTAVPVRFPKLNHPRLLDAWEPWNYKIKNYRRNREYLKQQQQKSSVF